MSIVAVRDLPERQATFVSLITKGYRPTDAAERAGYGGPHNTVAWRLLRMPQVIAAIHYEVQRQLATDAPNSLRVLIELRDSAATPARTRADISLQLLKLGGHIQPSTKENALEKPLNDMTAEELVGYIARNQEALERMEQELARRPEGELVAAIRADGAPHDTPHTSNEDAKALTYLD